MNIKSQIESLLFASVKPVAISELAKALSISTSNIKNALDELKADYETREAGIALINNGTRYQLATASYNAKLVKDFLKSEVSGELSQPSLETLTIIAYRGPISKLEIERIRGVNCSLIIRNLLLRGLIEEDYDKKKDISFYNVSLDFIRFLGISQREELPDFTKLSTTDTISRYLEDKESALS